ncbi:ROK family transcriptional regulator [Salinicola sp. JS01]|uniref:ROK family transcriptional regulator n=1 Tax=Salinicola sp. JS01 TaxID=3050071 RepID=UPI00255C14A7|nr:ROK family transcriptional regulator [Salinicola sp. JS01]WIX34051.1 ROK family transcriptional regulator [Salinicola sp. JS01]
MSNHFTPDHFTPNHFTPHAAGDLNYLKSLNRSTILSTVRRYPGLSRADIALRTGLTKATVGSVVNVLGERGWLREGELHARGGGRPGRSLYLDGEQHVMLGAEVGVKGLRVVACNLLGEGLASQRLDVSPTTPEETAAVLARLIEALLGDPAIAARPCLGLGVALPGPVAPQAPILRLAPNLGWVDIDFLALLRAELDSPAGVWLLDNEANAAAFGEFYFIEGTPPESIAYLSAGSGIGCGVVSGEHFPVIPRGHQGLVGEIGHTVLVADGAPCHCGNHGCAETLVSGWMLRESLGVAADASLSASLLARLDEPEVSAALARAGRALGLLMLNLHHTLNPSMLILGGSLIRLGAPLVAPALAYFDAHQNDLLRQSQRVPVKVVEDSTFTAARGAAAQVMARAAIEI